MGGISATTSPAFNGRTDPFGTYSSFNASVMYSSLETSGAKFGYLSAKEVLKNATGDMRFSFPFYSVYYVLVKQTNQPYCTSMRLYRTIHLANPDPTKTHSRRLLVPLQTGALWWWAYCCVELVRQATVVFQLIRVADLFLAMGYCSVRTSEFVVAVVVGLVVLSSKTVKSNSCCGWFGHEVLVRQWRVLVQSIELYLLP